MSVFKRVKVPPDFIPGFVFAGDPGIARGSTHLTVIALHMVVSFHGHHAHRLVGALLGDTYAVKAAAWGGTVVLQSTCCGSL